MAAVLRLVFGFVLSGALIGAVVASWAAPGYLQWDNTTGTAMSQCICSAVARETADRLIGIQLRGCMIGGSLGLVAGIGFAVWRRKRAKAASATS